MSSIYTIDRYFDYCIIGNVEGVYFCIIEGVDPEKGNKEQNKTNAFFYACKKNYV